MATTIGNLTLDGQFADWPLNDIVERPGNTVANYQVYGALVDDATGKNYVVGINAAVATDPVIAANTSIYLNTDQNAATGYLVFGYAIGAEYEVKFLLDANVLQPYLYSRTSAGTETLLNNGAPLNFGVSSDGESIEVAIPQALLTPTGGPAPTSINFAALINNGRWLCPAISPTRNTSSPIHRRWSRWITPSRRSASFFPRPPLRCISAAERPVKPPMPICSWRRSIRRRLPGSPMTS